MSENITGGRAISQRHTSIRVQLDRFLRAVARARLVLVARIPAPVLTASLPALVLAALVLAGVWLVSGCSTERVPTTMPDAHPDAWMDADSKDFHGRFVALDGTATCEKCHGIEAAGGPVGVSCLDCHGSGSAVCVDCHGGLDNQTGAPPYGLDGESADTALAVGAHSIHIEASSLGATVACDACHIVPPFVFSENHLDPARTPGQPLDSIAEITWHGIADGGGAAWDRTARTCSNTYCHGNFAGGTATNAPVWTGSGQAGCGSCHDVGGDPASLGWKHEYHINDAGLECYNCHAPVTNADYDIIDPSLHVNGVADTSIADWSVCNACHGSSEGGCTLCHGGTDNQTGAPPVGLESETATIQLAVGAHTTHMEGGDLADAFACTECHLVPSNLFSPEHLGSDEIAELTWSALAGAASTWSRANATCSAVYCHGNFAGGTATNAPVWTGGGQAGCGSCHDVGSNPSRLTGRHEKHVTEEGFDCIECHATVVSRSQVILNLALHVDGVKTVSFLQGGTYQNGSCSGLTTGTCHSSKSWTGGD